MKKSGGKKIIQRYELPGYERAGWEAREIAGKDCVLVAFDQTKTTVTLTSGLPVLGLRESMYEGSPGPGIRDTVLLGFVRNTGCVVLVDAIQIDGKRITSKPWPVRSEMLRLLRLGFDAERQAVYEISRIWRRGLMRAFDAVVKEGGEGLLLKHSARSDEILCLKEYDATTTK